MRKIRNIWQTMRHMGRMGRLMLCLVFFNLQCSVFDVQAQIRIGGNVYGGGNQAAVEGSTKVTVKAGDIGAVIEDDTPRPLADPKGKVFGGARMADVGGNTFVHIDGEHATDYIVINQVFGGNDITGHIGTAADVGETMPDELTAVKREPEDETDKKKNVVDDTWNSYVRLSSAATDNKKIYIGQLFGGGNGDYDYTTGDYAGFEVPEIDKTYLEVLGGSIVYAYGGGNNATVREKNIIHVDNPSEVVNHIWTDSNGVEVAEGTEGATDLLSTERFKEMGINTTFSKPSSDEFQVGRFFGGNNKADMAIRPTWNLLDGKIRNLYSGGNRGRMTNSEGLLLEVPEYSTLIVDNLYGGCRMADVMPTVDGRYQAVSNLPGYYFPDGLSARVLIRGGDINNVYGGNDVTGTVYGGNAIGIYSSIRGNVYGGGNGAYPYTDASDMEGDDVYGDFFYQTSEEHTLNYDALNAFRPNAEQVSIRLAGTDAAKPVVIKGSVYVGGNCATLSTRKQNPLVELKIGSHVIAENVFLGNNGEDMVYDDYLRLYANSNFSSLDLKDPSVFAHYMEGVAMNIQPSIVFDSTVNGDPADYEDNTTFIGSFFCGGNRGSMAIPEKNTYEVDRHLIIYDKFVGGCNNANVEETEYNAAYEGGVIGASDERASYTDDGGEIRDRLELNLENLNLVPLRWNNPEIKDFLLWNKNKWSEEVNAYVPVPTGPDFEKRDNRLLGANVYGGCYESGHVNGNVVININDSIVKTKEIFGEGTNFMGRPMSNIDFEGQRNDLMAISMSVFGAGYGKETEIWGSSTVNLNNGYVLKAYGGGELGVVGKKSAVDDGHGGVKEYVYEYNPAYSATVNLNGGVTASSDDGEVENLAEAECLYGGGHEGIVCGNTTVNLGNGRVYDVLGGSSNADILGGAQVIIGSNGGFPWVRDNVYGGNDFGGTIKGGIDHTASTSRTPFDGSLLTSSTYVQYIQGRVDSIFGGSYGSYDYADRIFVKYTNDDGSPKEGFSFPHLDSNSFVHFTPVDNANNHVSFIFGGSEGFPGHEKMNNSMQQESYVLIDDTQTKDANRFASMDIYGGGAFAGTGTYETLGAGRTAVDLFAGSFHNIYGGSNREGLIGYTRVNVPAESTAKVNAIFGGGKGYSSADIAKTPALAARYCDHYVTCIDYKGASAIVNDALYGGNENSRVACDTYLNIEAPVNQSSGYQATVYGGGYGTETVSGRTNVFMNSGSNAYKVFGGGRDGDAFNFASLQQWLGAQFATAGTAMEDVPARVTGYGDILRTFRTYLEDNPIKLPDNTGTYALSDGTYDGTYTNDILPTTEKPVPDYHQTNVHIMKGGYVGGYAYGGGYGAEAVVSGTTYIELRGGTVNRDMYGGGEGGTVLDTYGLKTFTATTNVYAEGGMVRNVYGGGYLGDVGKHEGDILDSDAEDIPAVANVTIGKLGTNTLMGGAPAVQRNVYGAGEGGSVYGSSNVTINNGYIGYRAINTGTADKPVYEYVEELDDKNPGDLDLSGNVFGGGYVINSYVDNTNINMYGGTVRGSLYGGGEVGPIGRASLKDNGTGYVQNGDAYIYSAGTTSVKMYSGHVLRNVFGGGRGKDSWGGDGTMYMDPSTVTSLKEKGLMCKGFVFGQTDVNIYGGEIGTEEGMERGFGNVFGGCDEGSVYSAYEQNGVTFVGKQSGSRYDKGDEGFYYRHNGTQFVNQAGTVLDGSAEKYLTEDCHVLVEPWLKVTTPFTYNSKSYAVGDYVPTDVLNTFGKKDKNTGIWPMQWSYLDTGTATEERGVIIHNAVFAGGNIAVGGEIFANTKTVFGNSSATIHDVFNRDLVTIGTGYTGGLYGDGNLTLVDGYRELNITNYGTDFYNIKDEISYDDYLLLPPREQAYYELKYKCVTPCTDNEGTTYSPGSTLPHDELLVLFAGNTEIFDSDGNPKDSYWTENGVVSRYAGRILNTIQRADFCGVFGSRMVMKGAKDRVPDIEDVNNYTVNRVREVSLNKKTSGGLDHGNYFGIYNAVKYLGGLTSDLDFHDAVRATDNIDATKYKCNAGEGGKAYGTATYADWKAAYHKDPRRNNGLSHNQVALASGVHLELTTEESTGESLEEKVWGQITGVVELDLINVAKGVGGGFVYAKNVHGIRQSSGKTHTIMTEKNMGAVTNKSWKYIETDETATDSQEEWQTSGNFVHNTQTIIDDCYNISNRYLMSDAGRMPAHYWYIRGTVYVYDQYITAHTGSANAYSKAVEIPISITAALNNRMHLMDVQPNLYAYYSAYDASSKTGTVLGEEQKMVINDVEYHLNDPISYWDWSTLPTAEKNLFVEETYINTKAYKTSEDSEDIIAANSQVELTMPTGELFSIAEGKMVPASDIFHPSNNMSHDNGYILTYKMTNPNVWDTWYTPANGGAKDQTGGTGYEDGPTYRPDVTKLYGQREYEKGAIIPEDIHDDYESLDTNKPATDDQATFVPAYIVTKEYTSDTQHYYPGAPVSTPISGYTEEAFVCTSTIQLSPTEYIYANDLMTASDITAYKNAYPSKTADIDELIVPAYYCTKAGLYGGKYYERTKNYRALEAYSAMSESDRSHFTFNYDALDLLIDPYFSKEEGKKYQYDGENFTTAEQAKTNAATYSLSTPVNYSATYDGTSLNLGTATVAVTHSNGTKGNVSIVTTGDVLDSDAFESLLNEQSHYAPIDVTSENVNKKIYVVNESFYHNEPFAAGQVIDKNTYDALPDTSKVDELTFNSTGTYYYCCDSYTIASGGTAVTDINSDKYSTEVPLKTIINSTQYSQLKNQQLNFTIHGESPMETSTLYVCRNADINDLSTEKIITVIYQYDYSESDESGLHITPVSERHVVNIHIKFESGVPTVDDIRQPDIVLPGTSITMRIPTVTPGSYEIIGGGWELFENNLDADSHVNGTEYVPSADPLYWYQDGFYLAYFARTYLGKTYSNAVPVSVANYHDLKRVMDDKENHLHVDYDRTRLKRDSKVYINDYSGSDENGLDLFRDFYELSVLESPEVNAETGLISIGDFEGHKPLNNSTETGTNIYDRSTNVKGVKGGQNLEFFLRTDIDHSSSSWATIGTDDICFKGNLHGDGHTVSGLDNSLFYNLCGSVYNLGVTGSFNTAGVVDKGTGYVESAWVKTTAPAAVTGKKPYAVFGDPSDNTGYQVVNSYFWDGNKDLYETSESDDVITSGGSRGTARAMTAQEFYNGTVAYNLNNFYLFKRYSDKKVTSGDENHKYSYFTIGDDEKPTLQNNHYYSARADLCSSGHEDEHGNVIMYVEDRFADGDYRYAGGTIPEQEDERFYTWTETDSQTGNETVESAFFPIWPDDYIFFGQKLTYGWATEAHQNMPTAVVRANGRLSADDDANRVYRAPAYYRSKDMAVAHFNPHAYLAQTKKDDTDTIAYPNMTAIDFKGHQDLAYQLGLNDGRFYTPLLDDDGLLSIKNCDETQNLLVYAPSADANAKTYSVLTDYFTEPIYTDYYDNTDGYRLVSEAPTASVLGHLVQNDLTATNDHLLVDKQDFNAPLAYTFDANHLMWYQRMPANAEYVDRTKGWQGISLPFTAELVTTHQKGEITHFYSGSATSQNGTGTKIGHEYWLREFDNIVEETSGEPATTVGRATFDYPKATGGEKTVTNTFLWDYYYKNEPVHNQKDKNDDTYLQYRQYYNRTRTYAGYPLLSAATPYILGLPGPTYYEFDLSGKFEAKNTAATVTKLERQIVTLASATGEHIGVSDDEMAGKKVRYNGTDYIFKPSYMNEALKAGTSRYALDGDGDSFDKVPASGDATAVSAFRPYFIAGDGATARRQLPGSILFSGTNGELNEEPEPSLDGSLEIYARNRIIVTRSHLKEPVDIRIVNAAGATLKTFVLQPGETIETPTVYSGVYIVNNKKVFVAE